MKRLLLYVHFNKFNRVSTHVYYQLEKLRPLFSNIIFISNSHLSENDKYLLKSENKFVDSILERQNIGFDFAAWRDGLHNVGWDTLPEYDSVTFMNDTCFGPLWDLEAYYTRFESNQEIDFWGMTNHRKTSKSRHSQGFPEHIQSYYLVFKHNVIVSDHFKKFWQSIQDFTKVSDVIEHYETKVTTVFTDVGLRYGVVFDTKNEDISQMLHPDFSFYNPTQILKHQVPFIKVKAIEHNQGISHYLIREIANTTNYPSELIVEHMSDISLPDAPYLLGQKYLNDLVLSENFAKKVAVHLHVFYVDLLADFVEAFRHFTFKYDLFITTDTDEKANQIKEYLTANKLKANVLVTGNIGRDVLPMLKLKEQLYQYDYIGHFHTKKSKEADFWAGESWRNELVDMMIKPANTIIANFETSNQGIVIADIPSFFRYNKITESWSEHIMAPIMNELWEKMNLSKHIDFMEFQNYVMSYGTFIWFKYDALSPLFDLNLSEADIPKEPLPQHSILHAIERILIYIAWAKHYDFRISQNKVALTPFIDNKQYNQRGDSNPHTYVDFTYLGGIKGAAKYIFIGPARAIKYIIKRLHERVKNGK